jgi:hypothetical protein
MPNTYTLISATTLSSSAATVTLGSIPDTYTDLHLVCSLRSDYSNTTNNAYVYFNSSDGGAAKFLSGNGSAASTLNINYNESYTGNINAATSTSNTFTSYSLYIPNYLSSNHKSSSQESVTENNATAAVAWLGARLWEFTAAVTSITFRLQFSTYAVGSTFYLYGIKKD